MLPLYAIVVGVFTNVLFFIILLLSRFSSKKLIDGGLFPAGPTGMNISRREILPFYPRQKLESISS
jgi:hypothetical protein